MRYIDYFAAPQFSEDVNVFYLARLLVGILLLPAFLAFTLLGFKYGVLWSSLIFIGYVVVMAADLMGYEYPMVTQADQMQLTRGFNWIMAFVTFIGLLLVNQFLNEKLKKKGTKKS